MKILTANETVRVYRNLTKQCYSVKAKSNQWRVVHYWSLLLSDCVFSVSKAGNKKVRKTKQKNVHAHVVGDFILEDRFFHPDQLKKVTYNPYKNTTFVFADTGKPVYSADLVFLSTDGCYVVCEEGCRINNK